MFFFQLSPGKKTEIELSMYAIGADRIHDGLRNELMWLGFIRWGYSDCECFFPTDSISFSLLLYPCFLLSFALPLLLCPRRIAWVCERKLIWIFSHKEIQGNTLSYPFSRPQESAHHLDHAAHCHLWTGRHVRAGALVQRLRRKQLKDIRVLLRRDVRHDARPRPQWQPEEEVAG